MKKHDLPAMPFYWGDWFKCPEVRALSPEARCLWFEMLGLMWESTERGYLTLNGRPMTKETLSRCLGFACDLLDRLLHELLEFGVYSVRPDGAIYNRRMVRDVEISKKRADAGRKGGVCSSKTRSKFQANDIANTEDEDESEESSQDPEEKETKPSWRTSFVVYKAEHDAAVARLLADKEWIADRVKFNPGVDIHMTVMKAATEYWGTEAGWAKKKSKRTKEIDWTSTYNWSVSHNKVYKPREGQKIGQVIGDRGEVLVYGKKRTDF